jgi:serine/threonine protein kinase
MWVSHIFINIIAIDLLEKLLKFDPAQRITVEDALKHGYVESYRDPADEPVHESLFDFSFESLDKIEDMKQAISEEVVKLKQLNGSELGSPKTSSPKTNARGARGSLSGPTRDAISNVEADDVKMELEEEDAAMDIDEELQRLENK